MVHSNFPVSIARSFRPFHARLAWAGIAMATALALGLSGGGAAAQILPQDENLTVFFTSDVQGEIKSCGCKQLDLGGATHRAAFLDTLRASGWEFVTLDAGGLVPFGPMNAQKQLKIELLARAMARMGFDGIGFGDWDLAQGPDFVAQLLSWLGQPVVATNYRLPAEERFPQVRSRELTVRGKRVGVVALLDPGLVTGAHDWITVEPWEEQRALIEELDGRVDALVAMAAAADSTRLLALAELYPQIDLLIGSHRGDTPVELLHVGTAGILGGGALGKWLGRSEIAFDDQGKVREVQALFLPVVERWGRRPWIDDLLGEYNRRLRELLLTGEPVEN